MTASHHGWASVRAAGQRSGLASVADAVDALSAGKMVIVVDDADRENEGDFVLAAEHVSPQAINFMATFGRGFDLRTYAYRDTGRT